MEKHAASVALALLRLTHPAPRPPRTSVVPAATPAPADHLAETKLSAAGTIADSKQPPPPAAEVFRPATTDWSVDGRRESPVVTFDVGGRLFRTRLSTVAVPAYGRLAGLARHAMVGVSPGGVPPPPIFIDRSPRYFEHILDHLRGVDVGLADLNASDVRRLVDEATYYGLPGLANALAPAPSEAYIRARLEHATAVIHHLASTIPPPAVDVLVEHEDAIHAWVDARARAIAATRAPSSVRPTVDEIDRASPFLAIAAHLACHHANVCTAAAAAPDSPLQFRGTPPPPPSPLITTPALPPSDALMHVNLEPH